MGKKVILAIGLCVAIFVIGVGTYLFKKGSDPFACFSDGYSYVILKSEAAGGGLGGGRTYTYLLRAEEPFMNSLIAFLNKSEQAEVSALTEFFVQDARAFSQSVPEADFSSHSFWDGKRIDGKSYRVLISPDKKYCFLQILSL